jgi:hypothetical protein
MIKKQIINLSHYLYFVIIKPAFSHSFNRRNQGVAVATKHSKSVVTPAGVSIPGVCIANVGLQTKYIIIFCLVMTGCSGKKTPKKISANIAEKQTQLSYNFLSKNSVDQNGDDPATVENTFNSDEFGQTEEQTLMQQDETQPQDKVDDEVKIQAIFTYKNVTTMGTEMVIQMAAAQGASLANQHITSQGQLLSDKIDRNSQTIQTSMKSFQNKAQIEQQKKLQSMIAAFSDAQKGVQAQTAQASVVSNLELDYIYKNISIDQPQQNYIFNQIQFDQLFTLGAMLTPAGALWKNPFSVGDWQYEKNTNSFWQYQIAPISNLVEGDDGTSTASSLQAENNAIFSEYFTSAQQYTIAGSITIYRIDYPAFIGIIFNKSRWISGDFESIRKSRLIGIYATSPTDIGVYCTQQYTMNDEQLKANPSDDPIQTPLQQILNKKVAAKTKLPSQLFANLQQEPITLHFEIINSPTSVNCILSAQGQEPINFTADNFNPALYMYHGIGCISPGAVTEFTLTQPQDLVFTQQAIATFKD